MKTIDASTLLELFFSSTELARLTVEDKSDNKIESLKAIFRAYGKLNGEDYQVTKDTMKQLEGAIQLRTELGKNAKLSV